MRTSFSAERMGFTKRAHIAAREQFYAPMFDGLPLSFEDTGSTIRDLDYAVDCIVAVTVEGLRAPLRFAVQERWREPEFMRYPDITITEWNLPTAQPSELHKFGAHVFVYGFYDSAEDRIVAAVAVDVLVLLRELACGRVTYTRNSRVDQTFVAFKVGDLRRIGAVVFGIDNRIRDVQAA